MKDILMAFLIFMAVGVGICYGFKYGDKKERMMNNKARNGGRDLE